MRRAFWRRLARLVWWEVAVILSTAAVALAAVPVLELGPAPWWPAPLALGMIGAGIALQLVGAKQRRDR